MGQIKKSAKKRCLFWGCLLLIWLAIFLGNLWIHNYHFKEVLTVAGSSDEDLIRIGVHRAMQMMLAYPPKVVPVTSAEDGSKDAFRPPAYVVPYHDVEHFLTENPDSCIVEKHDRYVIIKVRGKVFYKDNSGQIHISEPVNLHTSYISDKVMY